MAKYVNLTDWIFNSFCKNLSQFSSNRDPFYQAKRDLRYYIEDAFNRWTEDLVLQYIPRLPLSDKLMIKESKNVNYTQDITTDNNHSTWWTTNNQPVHNWALLGGKSFGNYFNPRVEECRHNLLLSPKLQYHKLSKMRCLCIKYQVTRKCPKFCNLTHILPSKLIPSDWADINNAFQNIYNWDIITSFTTLLSSSLQYHHPIRPS